MLRWSDLQVPPYKPDSRKLDKWLVNVVRQEPHLAGVMAQATSLIANRGWSLTGGKTVVNRVRRMMHNADRDEGARFGRGMRHFLKRGASAYYNTNMGFVAELGREGNIDPDPETGELDYIPPLAAIWSTDPTRFRLTGNSLYPLEYFPTNGRVQRWRHEDFFRIMANPSLLDTHRDLGLCAVLMCIELAKILIAVYRYDNEQLGSRAPIGLLLLQNISQQRWDDAMRGRKAELDGLERDLFGGVAVLAEKGPMAPDAKLIALANLPKGFDREQYVTLLMYLYALVFEFPPDEFWPVQTGGLGRNREAEIGMERATQKGEASFFLSFQERFQQELPAAGGGTPLVLFAFDERSDRGRLAEAELSLTWAKFAQTLYEAGLDVNAPLLTREQALSILVDKGILPPEFTEYEEMVQATDLHETRSKKIRRWRIEARERVELWRVAELFPKEPIVRYSYPEEKTYILWERGEELIRPALWRGISLEAR